MIEYKKYQLIEKTKEKDNVYTLIFTPIEGEVPYFRAGQFFMIKIDELEAKPNFRPYSSLMPYTKDRLFFGIKKHGVFSSALIKIKENGFVKIAGPYGQFLFDETFSESVFIAGGIGITPFVCILKELEQKKYNKKIYLFYSNKTKEDICYKKLLDEVQQKGFVKIIYTLTQEDLEGFEKGRINFEMIKKYIKDFQKAKYYICGGKEFCQELSKMLENNSIKKENIILEKW